MLNCRQHGPSHELSLSVVSSHLLSDRYCDSVAIPCFLLYRLAIRSLFVGVDGCDILLTCCQSLAPLQKNTRCNSTACLAFRNSGSCPLTDKNRATDMICKAHSLSTLDST